MGETAGVHHSSDTDNEFQKVVDEMTEEHHDTVSTESEDKNVTDSKLKAREGLVEYKDALEKKIESKRGEQEAKVKEKLELQQREQALDREISSLDSEIGTLRAEVANTDRTISTFDSKVEPVVMPNALEVDQVVAEAPVVTAQPVTEVQVPLPEPVDVIAATDSVVENTGQSKPSDHDSITVQGVDTSLSETPVAKAPEPPQLSDDFKGILAGYDLPENTVPATPDAAVSDVNVVAANRPIL